MSKPFLRIAMFCVVSALPFLCGFDSCFGTSSAPSAPPPGGFTVQVLDVTLSGINLGQDPGATINGSFVRNICAAGATNCPVGNVASFGFVSTGSYISGGIVPAFWQGLFKATCVDPTVTPGGLQWSTNVPGVNALVTVGDCVLGDAAGQFVLSGSVPATISIQGSGFTSASGLPQLSVYSSVGGLLSQTLASSVASDGSSATFTFPKNSSGTALAAGAYGLKISNRTAAGTFKPVAGGSLSIGSLNTSFASPYGVDAANTTTTTTGQSTGRSVTVDPIVTLFNSNQVAYRGGVVTVGAQPAAVKVYGNSTTSNTSCTSGCRLHSCCLTVTTSQPTRALVANSGSGTVSVLSINSGLSVTNTIAVGSQPIALLLKSDETKAYVANLGSGTVSEIDLSTFTQSRVVSVGTNPTSLALDPGGTAFWVGGLNYIKKIDMTSLAVTATDTVSGQVTSLAISSGQNAFVYTLVTSSNTFLAQHADLATGASAHTDFTTQAPAAASALSTSSSTSLPSWVMVTGPLVSANFGNRYVVEGTPTGFLVYDLQSNTQLLQGTTSSAVHAIATDPSEGMVFVTAPSSNSLYTIPLPPIQTN